MDTTDYELIKAFREGNRHAFDDLVDRYVDRVYSFVRRFVDDDAAAEDVVQETFIKVWKYRNRFDEKRSFKPWIFTIARNAALDSLRKKKEYAFSKLGDADDVDFGERLVDESISLPESFDKTILGGVLDETMKTLTPDQRAVVIFHDVEGLTFEEIGDAMHKPMNTVKSHYRRAILALRKKLEDRGYI